MPGREYRKNKATFHASSHQRLPASGAGAREAAWQVAQRIHPLCALGCRRHRQAPQGHCFCFSVQSGHRLALPPVSPQPRGCPWRPLAPPREASGLPPATTPAVSSRLDRYKTRHCRSSRRCTSPPPHSHVRGAIVPTPRQQGMTDEEPDAGSPRWSWARLLKRVFALDMARCPFCQ